MHCGARASHQIRLKSDLIELAMSLVLRATEAASEHVARRVALLNARRRHVLILRVRLMARLLHVLVNSRSLLRRLAVVRLDRRSFLDERDELLVAHLLFLDESIVLVDYGQLPLVDIIVVLSTDGYFSRC